MLEGWKAEVSPIYVKKLEKIMKLEGVKLKSYQAFDVLCGFVEKLFEVNKSSDYVFLMYGPQNPPQIPKINKFSWDFAFMLKLLKDEACYGNFLRLLQKMTTSTKVEDIHKFVIECMGNSWENNWKDVMYFLDEKKLIHIKGDKYDINVELMKSFVGIDKIKSILPKANLIKRELCDVMNIKIGLQCGGSDGFSGLTANPSLGAAVDILINHGGSAILSETPEIFGAETMPFSSIFSIKVAARL
jgi:hypothetical protein